MLNEGLILEPKEASHVQFMNDVGVFFPGLPFHRITQRIQLKLCHFWSTISGWEHLPFEFWQTTKYKPSCLQDENLRQKSIKVEEASQPMVTRWWLLRQQGGLGIPWEIGMCEARPQKASFEDKIGLDYDFATGSSILQCSIFLNWTKPWRYHPTT